MKRLFWLGLGFSLFFNAPLQAAPYAVTPAYYDDIKEILDALNLSSDEIPETTLQSYSSIQNYRAIFINCSGTIETNFNASAISAIQQYVAGGGVVYASDWAYTVIEKAFPGYVTYYSGYKVASSTFDVPTTIENSSMADYIGQSTVDIDFNLGGWVPIDSVKTSKVDVYLRAAGTYNYVNNKPVLVKFDYGQGSVIYTSFHNEAGLSGPAINALEYMVLLSVLSTTASNLARTLRDQGYIPVKENLDILAQSAPRTYTYSQSSLDPTDLAFAVAWRDAATFQTDIFTPASSLFDSVSGGVSPLIGYAEGATNGNWSYTVTPTVATSDQPFVAIAAKRIPAYSEVTSIKAYPNPFKASDHEVIVLEGFTVEGEVKIFSMNGKLVKTIHKNDTSGTVFWNADNDNGEPVASGLYIFTAEGTSGKIKTGKVVIIR